MSPSLLIPSSTALSVGQEERASRAGPPRLLPPHLANFITSTQIAISLSHTFTSRCSTDTDVRAQGAGGAGRRPDGERWRGRSGGWRKGMLGMVAGLLGPAAVDGDSALRFFA
jgi:hypothetical protein